MLLWAPLGAAQDAAELLREAAEAVRANRREAAFFVYQERIHERLHDRQGGVRASGVTAYEVLFVEGESYHRRTMLNGNPLEGEALEAEEQRMRKVAEFRRKTPLEERRRRFAAAERTRLRFDVQTMAENHLARFEQETECGAGRCLLIAVWPKPGARRPKHPNDWSLSLRGYLWLDVVTRHPVRAEVEQAFEYFGQPAGAQTRFQWARVDGVWLIQTIVSRTEQAKGSVAAREVVQEYSNYQRFRAESVVVFRDEP